MEIYILQPKERNEFDKWINNVSFLVFLLFLLLLLLLFLLLFIIIIIIFFFFFLFSSPGGSWRWRGTVKSPQEQQEQREAENEQHKHRCVNMIVQHGFLCWPQCCALYANSCASFSSITNQSTRFELVSIGRRASAWISMLVPCWSITCRLIASSLFQTQPIGVLGMNINRLVGMTLQHGFLCWPHVIRST